MNRLDKARLVGSYHALRGYPEYPAWYLSLSPESVQFVRWYETQKRGALEPGDSVPERAPLLAESFAGSLAAFREIGLAARLATSGIANAFPNLTVRLSVLNKAILQVEPKPLHQSEN